jgi:DNA-directed RNA polymerase specialized sigma24 family protein
MVLPPVENHVPASSFSRRDFLNRGSLLAKNGRDLHDRIEAVTASEALPPLENRVLRARARGEVSADAAFEMLYREYGRIVAAWLAVRVDSAAVDDLAQDVWLIFYGRFRRWEFGTEMESEEARPVLSFLFRTCQFVARGHLRLARSRKSEPLPEEIKVSVEPLLRNLEASRALALARRICSEEELDVLLLKLVGMSAREIARSFEMTEAVVDHRYRDALSRLRAEMKVEGGEKRKP